MASQIPAVKNTALTFYVGLVSQANTKVLQANPTLAAGDVKVSTDGGAFGNLATLPVVTPAAGKAVKVDLSAAEMNGDNVVVMFSDAAGAEWCDLEVNIQTSAQTFDAIKTETASIQSDTNDIQSRLPAALTAGGNMKADALAWAGAATATDDIALKATLAKGTDITGFNDLSAAQVNTEVDTAIADARLDELLAADSDIDGAAPPTVGSVFHELMSKTAGSFTFDQTTDSNEAVRDAITTPPTATAIADEVLSRNVSNVEGTMPEHCVGTVVLATLENSISGTTLTIKRTDGTTTHATKTLTVNASADPITGVA